ncbi:Endoplasmic reticulum mannosyl-oligosaccharide 1,2-alpha-mannosidase [Lachnellula subtilissima]|uniref:alpha-1,2-Mannosidase n=1 Tax=Lachnellula subtilissima TaxID=602034 RepID=A0A8H8UGP0_9HELO|nr:Endoplasmic reticulum mannosyl-oligosaccharide 1,2-alpha-mannosidase [Lachnellula subtilissima]
MGYKDKDDLHWNARSRDQSFVSSLRRQASNQKIIRGVGLTFFVLALFYFFRSSVFESSQTKFNYVPIPIRPERYPVASYLQLPKGAKKLPKIQHVPVPETAGAKAVRLQRLKEIRDAFLHSWKGYKKEAWAQDELRPIAGGYKSPFCGWAATMVDALDTLWIMELYEEFDIALKELENIDFTHTEGCQINLFETTIRHLGGLIATWDLTGGKYPILMTKALELAEILYTAFDTPNRMPSPHYYWSSTKDNAHDHMPSRSVVVAVLGSLSLEFTRLAQITGNTKYYDGIQRVTDELEKWQSETNLPGMWPSVVDATHVNESIALASPYAGTTELFTLGALADSTYEYLPKQFMMLGGQSKQPRTMYENFIEVAREHLFFRPMTVKEEDILISGTVDAFKGEEPRLKAEQQHLTCFAGGMLAIAGKIFNRPEDLADGARLTDGCVWAYRNTISGIMPETFTAVPCEDKKNCPWSSKKWFEAIDPDADDATIRARIKEKKLSPGFVHITDGRYLLRPEAIESVFIMYRITGNSYWTDAGWDMFRAIIAHCTTDIAACAIDNVLDAAPVQVDEMESFWLAETLKYFYLLYSNVGVVSLDEYVLNTEAHPLRRPV